MRRNVTELRIQLERERQRCTFLEQSYTYSLMAAQVAQQPPVTSLSSTQQAPAVTSQSTMEGTLSPPHVLPPNQLPPSPPQSRHTSTDEQVCSLYKIVLRVSPGAFAKYTAAHTNIPQIDITIIVK